MIARAKGRVKAKASYGNITVLSHLNSNFSSFKIIFITILSAIIRNAAITNSLSNMGLPMIFFLTGKGGGGGGRGMGVF